MTDAIDLFDKFQPIIDLRAGLLASGVEDPFGLVMEEVLSPKETLGVPIVAEAKAGPNWDEMKKI